MYEVTLTVMTECEEYACFHLCCSSHEFRPDIYRQVILPASGDAIKNHTSSGKFFKICLFCMAEKALRSSPAAAPLCCESGSELQKSGSSAQIELVSFAPE